MDRMARISGKIVADGISTRKPTSLDVVANLRAVIELLRESRWYISHYNNVSKEGARSIERKCVEVKGELERLHDMCREI